MPFQKGNQLRKGKASPNAGRKTDKDLQSLQNVLDEAIPHEERLQIFQVASARARAGDSGFAKIVLGYLYGTPIQRQEITGKDGGPVEMQHDVDDLRKLPADELTRMYRDKVRGSKES